MIKIKLKFCQVLAIAMFGFALVSSCGKAENQRENKIGNKEEDKVETGVKAILVTAKYCYNDYPPSYYFKGSDSIGVSIYFAGQIFNYTEDTLHIPSRQPYFDFEDEYDSSLQKSFFYGVLNGDTLFFNTFSMWAPKIPPKGSRNLNLQYYITPDKPDLLSIFKNIDKDQTILDTITIRYATPNMKLEREGVLLPPITLERSKKFKIKEAEYNSYFERIFKGSEHYENPSKKYLHEESKYDHLLKP